MLKNYDEISLMDDLLEFSLFKLKENDNMSITLYRMEKLIFKIKMELGEEHELYSKLPFYWYYYGPFSEVVKDSWFNLQFKCDNFLNSTYLKDEFFNNFNEENIIPSNYPEVNNIVQGIISDKESFYYDLDKEIYKNYAPYPLMYSFKYDLYETANKSNSPISFDVDKFINDFIDCESNLPFDSYFTEFSDIFSMLSMNFSIIHDQGNLNSNWPLLREAVMESWKTFVRGVRVKNKDDYYNSNEEYWNRKFQSSVKDLNFLISKTENLINLDSDDGNDYTKFESEFVNLAIKSYLGDEIEK